MKYSLIIKCPYSDYNYVVKKIMQNDIEIINSYIKEKEYYFVIYEDDYEKLLKSDYKNIIKFFRYNGILNIINYVKHNALYFIITTIICVILFLSNLLIIKVNIHTTDTTLNRLIRYYLADNNLDSFSFRKSYDEIYKIKKKLLEKHKEDIEWVEITKHGYIYDVYIIKRKKYKIISSNNKCNYIAKKSGTITKIIARKGVLLVQENNYINQGDILISGDVIYNEELKNTVCASGKIYGEVWYEVDVSYPLKRKEKTYFKKKFYNVSIRLFNKKYKLFKDKYNEYKNIKTIGTGRLGIDILSSLKARTRIVAIDENKAEKLSLKKARKSVLQKTHNKSKILSQNILKKYVKNGTIYLKVLITAEEELGVVESY